MRRYRSPYPAEFRQEMVELVRAGRTPYGLAKDFEPSATAIKKWVRQANRDAHLAYVADFDLLVAGPLLDDEGEMRGSLLVVDLPTREAVEAFVTHDPYTVAGLSEYSRIWGFRQTVGRVSLTS